MKTKPPGGNRAAATHDRQLLAGNSAEDSRRNSENQAASPAEQRTIPHPGAAWASRLEPLAPWVPPPGWRDWEISPPWQQQLMIEEVIIDGEPCLRAALIYVRGRVCVCDPLWLMFAEAGRA